MSSSFPLCCDVLTIYQDIGTAKPSPSLVVALQLVERMLKDGCTTASENLYVKHLPSSSELGYIKGQARVHTAMSIVLICVEQGLIAKMQKAFTWDFVGISCTCLEPCSRRLG